MTSLSSRLRRYAATALMAATAIIISTGLALASLSVETAKKQGLIGERQDGMLAPVAAATPEVRTLIAETNAARLARYKEIAARNGTELPQVQAIAGKKLIEKLSSGEYYMAVDGSWHQK